MMLIEFSHSLSFVQEEKQNKDEVDLYLFPKNDMYPPEQRKSRIVPKRVQLILDNRETDNVYAVSWKSISNYI